MILNFRHKGLEGLFNTGSKKGIIPEQADRLSRMLDRLATSKKSQDMDLPGYGLHELKGRMAGTWAVRVSGNWRLIFQFDGENAVNVDYIDYH